MKIRLSMLQSLMIIGRAAKEIYDEGKAIYRDVRGEPEEEIEEGVVIDSEEEEDED